MTLSQEQFDLIEAYLANELSLADAQAFEQEIVADLALRAEVETQRAFRMGLKALAIEQRLQRARQRVLITGKDSSLPDSKRIAPVVRPLVSQSGVPVWTRWAASAIVVLGVGFGVYWYQHQELPELAYADSATAYQLSKGLPADLSFSDRQRIMNAIRHYKMGQYDQVIEKLKIPTTDRRMAAYQDYFLGLSLLAKKEPAQAIAPLKTALGTSSLQIRQKASWFLALAYLKTNDKRKALPILDSIRTNRAHPYHELAERVYAKVK